MAAGRVMPRYFGPVALAIMPVGRRIRAARWQLVPGHPISREMDGCSHVLSNEAFAECLDHAMRFGVEDARSPGL